MDRKDLEQLKEVLREIVGESHQGVSKSVSDNVGSLSKNVHALKEEFIGMRITMDNLLIEKKIQNGKVLKNQDNIQKLMQWKYWIMGGLGVILFIIPYFSYTNTQQFNEIKQEIKEIVKSIDI